MNHKIVTRLVAAILYLITSLFFAGIILILYSIGGDDAFNLLFATDRTMAIFLLISTVFSLANSLLLFSSIKLSQVHRLTLLIINGIYAVTVVFFATEWAVAMILPLWALFRLYRETNTQ